jgi:hypothetical protein
MNTEYRRLEVGFASVDVVHFCVARVRALSGPTSFGISHIRLVRTVGPQEDSTAGQRQDVDNG